MDIDLVFPFKLCINLDRQEERRRMASEEFRKHHLHVIRQPAVEAIRFKKCWPFTTPIDRACAATLRYALRQAIQKEVSAVLIFEDDVILHDDFRQKVKRLILPEDWKLFYFGCQHYSQPTPFSRGMVRVQQAFDTHAIGIRSTAFSNVLSVISTRTKNYKKPLPAIDVLISNLHPKLETYAAFPNLAWQRECYSDRTGARYTNYTPQGEQKLWPEAVQGLLSLSSERPML